MKRTLCLLCLLATLFAPACGFALEGEPLSGTQYYPTGADEASARYFFDYRFPQLLVQTQADELINQALFRDMEDYLTWTAPQLAQSRLEELLPDEPAGRLSVDYQLMADNEDYTSFLLSVSSFSSANETSVVWASTYARTGEYIGKKLTLSQVMGLETSDPDAARGKDTLLGKRVYDLVSEIITQPGEDFTVEYFPDLMKEELQQAFLPEEDFYLDENGNIVFYIQSGVIASEMYGVITFPFSRAELLMALTE